MKTDLDEIKKLLNQSKQNKLNTALCVGLFITLLAAVAGAVWFFCFKDKQDGDWDDEDWDDDDFDDYDDDCECDVCDDQVKESEDTQDQQ